MIYLIAFVNFGIISMSISVSVLRFMPASTLVVQYFKENYRNNYLSTGYFSAICFYICSFKASEILFGIHSSLCHKAADDVSMINKE